MSEADAAAPEAQAGPSEPAEPAKARWFEFGSVAQSSVPGMYAWFVTVAPAAWARGAPLAVKPVALAGVALLVASALFERRAPRVSRLVSIWGFAGTSVFVWALAPAALAPSRLDATRGMTGMIAWALFAYASAAPAVARAPASAADESSALKPRDRLPRGDALFVGVGVVLAIAIQALGWRVPSPERAVLVRLVCVALGMAVIGASTSIALSRHGARAAATPRSRARVVVPWVLAILLLGACGAALRLGR